MSGKLSMLSVFRNGSVCALYLEQVFFVYLALELQKLYAEEESALCIETTCFG